MNRENLLKMAKFIATVPQEQFDMDAFIKCGSVGCSIGVCFVNDVLPELSSKFAKRLPAPHNYGGYSIAATGFNNSGDVRWRWCFQAGWHYIDNTPYGAAQRIIYLLQLKGNDATVQEHLGHLIWRGETTVQKYKDVNVEEFEL